MEASSDNKENKTEKDNQRVATLKMVALSPLTIKGESKPKQTNYDNGTIREDVIARYITSQSRQSALEFHSTNKTSPRIRHVFVVENPGPSQVKAVDFAVNWPAYLGDVRHYHLLYLVDVDVTSGSGKCEAESIDPRHLWVLETENETYPNSGVNAARRRESVADSSSSDNAGLAARLSSLFDRQTNPSLECPGPQKPTKIKSRATLQKTLKEKPGTRERASVTRAISSRVKCVQISCHFDFEISDGATVEVTSYLWTPTLNTKWPEGVEVKLTSAANAWIVSRPEDYPSDSEEGMDIQSTPYHVTTTLSPWRLPPRPLEIPLWVVGVSVGGGLFLLLLLIFILRKLGFFVRKKEKDFRRMTHRAEKLKSYSLEEMEDL